MSQNNLDRLIIWGLLLTSIGDLLGLFVEIQNQRQARKQEQEEKQTQEEIRELRHDIELLNMQLIKK